MERLPSNSNSSSSSRSSENSNNNNNELKKGPWTPEEDQKLIDFIEKHGQGSWQLLPKKARLNRCGKSCRLRWTNYLRPDIRRGNFTPQEEQDIIDLHSVLGNKWSTIAARLPGRTDNEIKNYWNTHLRKKLLRSGIDPKTHQPLMMNTITTHDHLHLTNFLLNLPLPPASPSNVNNIINSNPLDINLAKIRILSNILQVLNTNINVPNYPTNMILGGSPPPPPQVGVLLPNYNHEFDHHHELLLNNSIPNNYSVNLNPLLSCNSLNVEHQPVFESFFKIPEIPSHGKNITINSNSNSEFSRLPALFPSTPEISSSGRINQFHSTTTVDESNNNTNNICQADENIWGTIGLDDEAISSASNFWKDMFNESFPTS